MSNPENHEYKKGLWVNECEICARPWFDNIHRGPWDGTFGEAELV